MSAKRRTSPKILGDPEEITASAPPAQRRAGGDEAVDQAAEERRQQAFDAEPVFRGQPLEPFSISREGVFLQLRTSLGAPPLYDALADGATWWPDALRLLWLCGHHPADWRDLRADAHAFQAAIDDWAEAQAVRADRLEIVRLTLRLWDDSRVNQHLPAGKGHPEGN